MGPDSMVNSEPYLPNLNAIQCERYDRHDAYQLLSIIQLGPKQKAFMSSYGDEPGIILVLLYLNITNDVNSATHKKKEIDKSTICTQKKQ